MSITIDLWWSCGAGAASTESISDISLQYAGNSGSVERDDFGKPRFADPEARTFNASHSGGFVLIGVADRQPVGVDCEAIREFDDLVGVSELVFTDAEQAWVGVHGADRDVDRFFALWSRKEAVVKAIGQGLQIPLKSFEVLTSDMNAPLETAIPTFGTWWVSSVDAPDGIAAACASCEPFTTHLRRSWMTAIV